ncbi:MAG: SDR family NAD(P)-dependent oxidoreductase [Steroidobacteraceae bacterium]
MIDQNRIGTRLAGIFELTDRVAIVTGSAQGLGRDTAWLLAEVGARTVIADFNVEGAKAVATQIETAGGIAFPCHVDLSSEESIKRMFEAVDGQFGCVDVLVNNVADRSKAEFFDMTVAEWDRMFNVTARGTFLCCREAVTRMRRGGRGGSIVNISTVGAVRTTLWGVNAHYDAAKSAVDSLTRTLGGEFASEGIRVNSVLPGGMASEGARNISAAFKIRGPMIGPGRIPMGRIADPKEVAQAVLFFASPASRYITGQLLGVDGGFMVS